MITEPTKLSDFVICLDRCHCRSRGRLVQHLNGVSVDCDECSEGTEVMPDKYDAVIAWNKLQRKYGKDV